MDGDGHAVARIDYMPHVHKERLKLSVSRDWHDGGDFDATGDNSASMAGVTEDGKALVRVVQPADSTVKLVRYEIGSGAETTTLFSNDQYDVGASYGGYAALAGATFTPGLYACAASVAGVSDLPKMPSSERLDYDKDSHSVSFWFSRIGSTYEDGTKIRETSPALHAAIR